MNRYVLDACSLIAFLEDEVGADIVQSILKDAKLKTLELYMNKLNLFEVYYGILREDGFKRADGIYNMILHLPITINSDISDEVFREAGRLKASYKISLADSIALAQSVVLNASLVTSDHHEFDIIEEKENISFTWIR